MKYRLPDDATIRQLPNGMWQCTVPTHNWASDFYDVRAKTREKVINKAIHIILQDRKDRLILIQEDE